jgi:Icc-related predicted phosphoesterase
MIRLAAVADVHFADDARGTLRPHLEELPRTADVFLIAGDLTRLGLAEEAEALADELADLDLPIVSILGNHDYHSDEEKAIRVVMEAVGVVMLEAENHVIEVDGERLGISGVKGFGSGFPGASASDFGEPEMKAFVRHASDTADRLGELLAELDTDRKVALVHYAPVEDTLRGERRELFPFLGSYLLGEAIDRAGADLAIHGHAHAGAEKGMTSGGVQVRNVALPLIQRPYNLYCLGTDDDVAS